MSWQILLKKVNHREIYLHPTLSSVDFSEEGEFRTPIRPCTWRLRGCEGVIVVSGPLDPFNSNSDWINGCKPCFNKKREEAMRD